MEACENVQRFGEVCGKVGPRRPQPRRFRLALSLRLKSQRQEDKETRRQGDRETRRLDEPCSDEGQAVPGATTGRPPPLSLSPCLLVSLSMRGRRLAAKRTWG